MTVAGLLAVLLSVFGNLQAPPPRSPAPETVTVETLAPVTVSQDEIVER